MNRSSFRHLRWLFLAAALFVTAGFSAVPAHAADTNKLVQKAIKMYEKGDYDKALKLFVKVLHVDPNHSMAREYMLLCSQKIVEQKLGASAADTLEKEIAAELHFQETSLSTPTAAMPETEPEPDEPILTTPVGLPAKSALPTAQSLLEQSDILSDNLRRRHIGLENIVELDESGGKIVVTLYMNRLFLPYSDILRDESYVILNHVSQRIKSNPKRKVVLKAIDPPSPNVRKFMPALATRRCTVVMSYLIYSSFLPDEKEIASAR